jgi:hypothetical protein
LGALGDLAQNRSAKPLFIGSIPIAASNEPFKILRVSRAGYLK